MLGTRAPRTHWDFPEKRSIAGRYMLLEPLSLAHAEPLFKLAQAAPDSFTYLRYGPFAQLDALREILADLTTREDQPFWAVINSDGTPQGWLSICDVSQTDGAFEIGSIWFAPALQGTPAAREAIFKLMCLGMDDLAYERLVWRCQAQNARSMQAAVNLGFEPEGIWRRAAIVDGWQRDVAWFSILRDTWPACRAALEAWLDPGNFDAQGRQIKRLQELRSAA
ncbi:RimJ/RimL family protein N-acetyltransferase [Litoreibacter ponti]|uniref:RimJ/RimL family protein N-acetyltransferase n=1 Tax=Litoreibacter ponti TaxID=1510457 RepID=A0A2T6BHR9_9RHOB|nr:GNAT family protein [Litoreibacter ponti]PTX55607.1 RimJ/RimL family protein N-acetyltransferase [Litoreibacter ponti]